MFAYRKEAAEQDEGKVQANALINQIGERAICSHAEAEHAHTYTWHGVCILGQLLVSSRRLQQEKESGSEMVDSVCVQCLGAGCQDRK